MFYNFWKGAGRREWLNLAIGLYLASNHNYSGIEICLTISQMLLETLTWVALQQENSLMSDASFEKLPASDKIQALLFWFGISTEMPKALTNFQSTFPELNAPDATVNIRNVITHPSKKQRSKRTAISNFAIDDACQLNLWYSDLTIFKLIGYSGRYNNRTGNPAGILDTTPSTAKPLIEPSDS